MRTNQQTLSIAIANEQLARRRLQLAIDNLLETQTMKEAAMRLVMNDIFGPLPPHSAFTDGLGMPFTTLASFRHMPNGSESSQQTRMGGPWLDNTPDISHIFGPDRDDSESFGWALPPSMYMPRWVSIPVPTLQRQQQRRQQSPIQSWRRYKVESPDDPPIEFTTDGFAAARPWSSTLRVLPILDLTPRIPGDIKYNARVAWHDFCAAFYLPLRIPATRTRLMHRVLRILRWIVNRKVRVIAKYRREREQRFEELA